MAKRYIDKTPDEIRKERSAGFQKRMANLARIGESAVDKSVGIATGIAKEEVFGIPGMFADLSGLAQYATNPFTYGTNEALQKASEDLIDDLGASALAAKAGVELSDEMFDEEGELRPEMIGRMLAPGALYAKGAALIPELSAGVQSLVRGLRDEGFFPAGGPQPATVGGPSPMTQAPDDAGPRSMVVRSESQEPPTGGTAPKKPLVSTERDEMLVSPENEGIINELELTGVKKKGETGVSDTGLYHPLVAAMQNALQDFPKDGMPAAKLLERLRGQPRAGTQIRSIGLDKILQPMGNDRVTREQLGGIMAGINPQFKTKVVLHKGGEYAGQTLPSTITSHSSLQRQQQTVDDLNTTSETEQNYGVLLFGDEQSNVDGRYLRNLGHNYFDSQLPGFFGHVRFSIQKMPDPSGAREFIDVALIEEIQSDAVKLFQQAEREGKIPSRAQVEKELKASDTGLLDEGEDISDLVDARMEELQKAADDRVSNLLQGRKFYGPEEKLTNSFLDLSPEFQKFMELEEIRELATNSDKIFQSNRYKAIETELNSLKPNTSFLNQAQIADMQLDVDKFFLINGLHKANSERELKALVEKLARGGTGRMSEGANNLPATFKFTSPESELNPVEIYEVRLNQLVERWKETQKHAEAKLQRSAKEQKTGISSLIQKAIGSRTIDSDMAESRREAVINEIAESMRDRRIAMAGNEIHKKYADDILKVKAKPAKQDLPEDYTEYQDSIDPRIDNDAVDAKESAGGFILESQREMRPQYNKNKDDGSGKSVLADEDSGLHPDYPSLREFVSINELKDVLKEDGLDLIENQMESLLMELNSLEQLDPVFSGVRNIKFDDSTSGGVFVSPTIERAKRKFRRDALKSTGGYVGDKQLKLKLYKDSIIKEVEEAKAKMPTDEEMLKATKNLLENKVAGPLFRKRFDLLEDLTAEEIVAAPNVRAVSGPFKSGDRATVDGQPVPMREGADPRLKPPLNQPPFRDQNEFIQFAVRNIPVEMKKLGVDGVVFPRAEEFIAARDSETMTPNDLERYKIFLDKEAKLNAAVQKLQRMKKDDDLISKTELDGLGITNILEELGALDGKSLVSKDEINEFKRDEVGIDIKELIEKIKSLMQKNSGRDAATNLTGGTRFDMYKARRVRGHMQNYGQSMEAGLKKLKMPIIELDTFNVLGVDPANQQPIAKQIGAYPGKFGEDAVMAVAKDRYDFADDVPTDQRVKSIEIPKYRFIDLREGKPGADVA
ncbi:MAG: hypothetical protein ACO3N9_12590, partial [Alphaproteobacteria bacterium]